MLVMCNNDKQRDFIMHESCCLPATAGTEHNQVKLAAVW